MKQHITQEQWEEITEAQAVGFYVTLGQFSNSKIVAAFPAEIYTKANDWEFPSLGEMIQFLGEDWIGLVYTAECNIACGDSVFGVGMKHEELCDALWEAVKWKLNKTDDE